MLRQFVNNAYNRVSQFGLKTVPKYIKQAHTGMLKAIPYVRKVNAITQGINRGAQSSPHYSSEVKGNLRKLADFSGNLDKQLEKTAVKTELIHDILMS
jgi:uncharacterized phage infection (PIP) family protein YhgE